MINGIKQKAIVGEGGRIEILSSELPAGAVVEVIILLEPAELDTTDYLLSTEANRNHLRQALTALEQRETYIHLDPADL
jgi:antitoxin YefM